MGLGGVGVGGWYLAMVCSRLLTSPMTCFESRRSSRSWLGLGLGLGLGEGLGEASKQAGLTRQVVQVEQMEQGESGEQGE